MPAIDLTQGPKTLLRYDVVGERVEGQTHFVKHVGLHDEDRRSAESGGEINAVHMRPPLEQGGTFKTHVAGHVPLTNDEITKISIWITKIVDEYPKSPQKQYVIHPPWKDEYDPITGVRRYRRYSCAGFVIDSHLHVGIELLNIDEGVLPDVDKQTIISAYPNVDQNPGLLRRFGLEGNGPWKVVLAGYVLHALNRPTNQIRRKRYQATHSDKEF